MDFKFLIHSLKNIMLNPAKEWDTIHSENKPVRYVKWSFIFPLITLTSVSVFLGSFLFINAGLSEVYSVFRGIKYFILIYFVIFGTAFALYKFLNILSLGKDFGLSFKLIAYSATPFFICQIISQLFESFIFVNVLALFGLYIFWTGIDEMLDPPEPKKFQLLVVATVIFIALFFAGNWFLTNMADKLYFTFFF